MTSEGEAAEVLARVLAEAYKRADKYKDQLGEDVAQALTETSKRAKYERQVRTAERQAKVIEQVVLDALRRHGLEVPGTGSRPSSEFILRREGHEISDAIDIFTDATSGQPFVRVLLDTYNARLVEAYEAGFTAGYGKGHRDGRADEGGAGSLAYLPVRPSAGPVSAAAAAR